MCVVFCLLQLEVDQNDYLGTILNMTRFGTEYGFGRLREPVNKTEWITHGRPAIVNAFYSSIENSIRMYIINFILSTVDISNTILNTCFDL